MTSILTGGSLTLNGQRLRLAMAGDIGRETELPHQEHGLALRIERQDHRAVAAIVSLASLRLPLPRRNASPMS